MTADPARLTETLAHAVCRGLLDREVPHRNADCEHLAAVLAPHVRRYTAQQLRDAADDIRRTTVLGHIAERLERRADQLTEGNTDAD